MAKPQAALRKSESGLSKAKWQRLTEDTGGSALRKAREMGRKTARRSPS
jgi:hypothetical protein